jgi:hypothetical protein
MLGTGNYAYELVSHHSQSIPSHIYYNWWVFGQDNKQLGKNIQDYRNIRQFDEEKPVNPQVIEFQKK